MLFRVGGENPGAERIPFNRHVTFGERVGEGSMDLGEHDPKHFVKFRNSNSTLFPAQVVARMETLAFDRRCIDTARPT